MFVTYGGLYFLLSCKTVGPSTNKFDFRIVFLKSELLTEVVVGTNYIDSQKQYSGVGFISKMVSSFVPRK